MYRMRKTPQEPPCHQCKVELMERNEDAAKVYIMTRRQVVTAGMGQAVDISIPAVKIAMELYGVKDQLDCLNMVRRVFHKMEERKDEGRSLEP